MIVVLMLCWLLAGFARWFIFRRKLHADYDMQLPIIDYIALVPVSLGGPVTLIIALLAP